MKNKKPSYAALVREVGALKAMNQAQAASLAVQTEESHRNLRAKMAAIEEATKVTAEFAAAKIHFDFCGHLLDGLLAQRTHGGVELTLAQRIATLK